MEHRKTSLSVVQNATCLAHGRGLALAMPFTVVGRQSSVVSQPFDKVSWMRLQLSSDLGHSTLHDGLSCILFKPNTIRQ